MLNLHFALRPSPSLQRSEKAQWINGCNRCAIAHGNWYIRVSLIGRKTTSLAGEHFDFSPLMCLIIHEPDHRLRITAPPETLVSVNILTVITVLCSAYKLSVVNIINFIRIIGIASFSTVELLLVIVVMLYITTYSVLLCSSSKDKLCWQCNL